MRIGIPPGDAVLVVASVAAVVLTLNLVHQTPEPGASQSSQSVVPTGPGQRLPLLVVVAGNSPSDVAVGQPVADAAGGALLAMDATGLTEVMAAELSRSRPDRVLVLGGPAAVSEATVSALRQLTRGSVTRLAGVDRFDTAASVAKSRFTSPLMSVRIAAGDATTVPSTTPERTGADTPVLLVERDRIPPSTAAALRALRPRRIEVIGGHSAVSDGVLDQLQVYTPGPVVRSP